MIELKRIIPNLTIIACLIIVFALPFQSCKKAIEDPKAEITILDSNGTAISDAKVVLSCVQRPNVSLECNVADTQYTDGVGRANFEFINSSILRVIVHKYNTREIETGTFPNIEIKVVGDTLCAEGFITLESNEVTEEVFVVEKCASSSENSD